MAGSSPQQHQFVQFVTSLLKVTPKKEDHGSKICTVRHRYTLEWNWSHDFPIVKFHITRFCDDQSEDRRKAPPTPCPFKRYNDGTVNNCTRRWEISVFCPNQMNMAIIPFTSIYNKVKHSDGTARGTMSDTSFQVRQFHVGR